MSKKDVIWVGPLLPYRCALYGNRLHLCLGDRCHRKEGCKARGGEKLK